MKKKSFLVGALLAHSMFTFADAKFSVADLTIAAGEQRTVAVNVELTDKTELSAFEMDIQLPAGLTFKGFDEVMTTTDLPLSAVPQMLHSVCCCNTMLSEKKLGSLTCACKGKKVKR